MNLRDRLHGSIGRREPQASSQSRSRGAVEALRETWSRYPNEWKQDPELNLGAGTLGEEWGGAAFADYMVDLVAPYLGGDRDVLELGCGGGKFSQRLAPRCRSLLCTDISEAMIEHARETLSARGVAGNVSYRLLNGVDFDGVAADSVDFVFSYDVQLHLQPQNVFSYLVDARRIVREGGVFMLHQINLASRGGMSHFLSQYDAETWKRDFDDPRRRGHVYFMSEDQMRALAAEAGFSIVRIVSNHGEFDGVTGGRDLIGFLRRRPSRLHVVDRGSLRLVKAAEDETVYVVIGDRRFAFGSAHQFERAGLRWDHVHEVSQSELAAIPDGGPLEPWE